MFFRALDLLPMEEEIYLLSLDIPVTFFLTGRGKWTERGHFPVQGYAKRMKNDSACSEFRVVLCLILAMNGKGFQC